MQNKRFVATSKWSFVPIKKHVKYTFVLFVPYVQKSSKSNVALMWFLCLPQWGSERERKGNYCLCQSPIIGCQSNNLMYQEIMFRTLPRHSVKPCETKSCGVPLRVDSDFGAQLTLKSTGGDFKTFFFNLPNTVHLCSDKEKKKQFLPPF